MVKKGLFLALVVIVIFTSCATVDVFEKIEPLKAEPIKVVESIKGDFTLSIVVSENIFDSLETQEFANGQKMVLFNGDVFSDELLMAYLNSFNQNSVDLLTSYINSKDFDGSSVSPTSLSTKSQLYEAISLKVETPFLAANLLALNEELLPYVILEKGPLKIVVVGFTLNKFLAEDIREKGAAIVQQIEDLEADLVIALVNNTPETESLANSLAAEAQIFDVVFINTNANKQTLANLSFNYDKDLNKYLLNNIETKQIEVTETSSEIQEALRKWSLMPIGLISESISTRDALFGDSKSVDLIHSIQLENSLGELSIAAIPSFDTTLEKGEISTKDLFDFYPKDSYIYTLKLSGKEIKAYLENSYGKWFNQMKSLDDDLLNFNGELKSSNCVNFDSLSGVNYVVDITKAAGQKVTLKTVGTAEAFKSDKVYNVAIASFKVDQKESPFLAIGLSKNEIEDRIIGTSDKTIRSYLIEAFTQKEVIPTLDNNWIAIPNLWVQRGFKTSYPKLFPNR
ncbi:MAG: 5'-nucleotidase C-terminal domain-containing protein [Sphaerochaetaceae bacterium]